MVGVDARDVLLHLTHEVDTQRGVHWNEDVDVHLQLVHRVQCQPTIDLEKDDVIRQEANVLRILAKVLDVSHERHDQLPQEHFAGRTGPLARHGDCRRHHMCDARRAGSFTTHTSKVCSALPSGIVSKDTIMSSCVRAATEWLPCSFVICNRATYIANARHQSFRNALLKLSVTTP